MASAVGATVAANAVDGHREDKKLLSKSFRKASQKMVNDSAGVLHFTVTKPLGLHARGCARIVKIIREIASETGEAGQFWIVYGQKKIAADSLFELLGQMIGCGAEFDLVYEPASLLSQQQEMALCEKLAEVI